MILLLFILLAVDDAATFHRDITFDAGAIVALVLAIIAAVLLLKDRA